MSQFFLKLVAATAIVAPYVYADTIESALAETYRTSTDIKIKTAALQAAKEKLRQAKSGFCPDVTLGTGIGRRDQNNSGDYIDRSRRLPNQGGESKNGATTANFTAEGRVNLFQGGGTVYNIQQAEAGVKAAEADLKATIQKNLAEAAKAYIELVVAEKYLKHQVNNENYLKEILASNEKKFGVGEETKANVADSQSEYANGIAQRLAAEAKVEGAKATYENAVGVKPGKLADPTLPKCMPTSLTTALDQTTRLNPAVIQAIYKEIGARREIDKVRASFLPRIDFTISSKRSEADTSKRYAGQQIQNVTDYDPLRKEKKNTTDNGFGVDLRWELDLNGKTRSMAREAAHKAEQERWAIENVRQDLVEALTKSWEQYLANKDSVIKRQDQVKAAEVALEATRQEQQVGSRIMLDVLNSQRRLVSAQNALVETQGEHYKAAYEIVRLTGALTPENLCIKVS